MTNSPLSHRIQTLEDRAALKGRQQTIEITEDIAKGTACCLVVLFANQTSNSLWRNSEVVVA